MNKSLDKLKMGKFQQPTSILYYGKNLFFFQKDFKEGRMKYTLQ